MRTSTTVARRALDVAGVCVVVACPLPQAHAAVVSGHGRDECASGPGGVGPGVWVTVSASAGAGVETGGGGASPTPWPSHSAAPKPSPSALGGGGGSEDGGRTGISAAETSAADSGVGVTLHGRSGLRPAVPPRGTQGSATPLGLVAAAGAGVPVQIGSTSPGVAVQVSQTSSHGTAGPVVPRADRERAAALARDQRQALALLTTLLVIALVPVVLHLALRRRGRR